MFQIAKESPSLARITHLGFKILAVDLLGKQKSKVSENKSPLGLPFKTMVRQNTNMYISKIFYSLRALPLPPTRHRILCIHVPLHTFEALPFHPRGKKGSSLENWYFNRISFSFSEHFLLFSKIWCPFCMCIPLQSLTSVINPFPHSSDIQTFQKAMCLTFSKDWMSGCLFLPSCSDLKYSHRNHIIYNAVL